MYIIKHGLLALGDWATCNVSDLVNDYGATEVTNVDDIQVSDIIMCYKSGGSWYHVMWVGEIADNGEITVYDGGSYFQKHGGDYKRTNMNDDLASGLASGKYRIFHVSDLDGTSSLSGYVYDSDDEDNEYTSSTLEEWFQTDDYEAYIVKMIRAEITSTYPKLGDYEGNDGTEDDQGNKRDDDGDYVAQGIVEIQRTTIDEDGNTGSATTLTYLPHDSLSSLISSGDSSALNYFSFDSSSGLIYYATYSKTIVTENGTEISSTYTLKENSASYSALVSMTSMPYNFLFALLQTTDNPEYVMAVIDLLLEESEVVLMIQDQLSITEQIIDEYKAQKTTTQELTTGWDTEQEYGYWVYGDEETEYEFPETSTLKETIITTYTNTANVYIQKANTWCMDFEQQATISSSVSEGSAVITEYSDDDLAELTYTLTSSNRSSIPETASGTYTITEKYISDDYLTYSNQVNTTNYTSNTSISTEKRINYEKFLGLWKNDTGEYYLGCLYDESGKEVYYEIPPDYNDTESPVIALSADGDEENIDLVIELLSEHEDTQIHEQLMMYYWNVYIGEDVYDVDLDELLNLFNTSTFTSLSGSSIYGSSIEEKVWFALIDAGYSEYAAAGAMGNIWAESGFQSNNMQNSYEGTYNDETYTAAVDNGTYTNFNSDSIGYGLCQWTSSGRKAGLLSYAQSKGVSISDENMQIEYLLAELDSTNSSAASSYASYQLLTYKGYSADSWINASSVSSAATAFCWSFERPGSPNLSARISQAEYYYSQFHGRTRATYDSSIETITVGSYTFPHYLQKNYSGSYGTSTISASGCGPTSLAMILSGLLGDASIDPTTVVANIKDYWPDGSYYVSGVGSSHCIFRSDFLSKYYGVTSTLYPSESEALAALDAGYCVIGGETRTYTCYSTSIKRAKSTRI